MDKEKLCEQLEQQVEEILNEGIQADNVTMLGKLIDIKKDLANMEYWDKKEEVMDMRGYRGDYDMRGYGRDNYGRRGRNSRGRYTEGDEMIEDMKEHYGNYMEGRNYGGNEADKAFDYMLKSAEEFFVYLMDESDNPEQMEKIKRTARKISEMR